MPSYQTDAFGVPEASQGPSSQQPFGFTGQQADNDGLVYLRARYYDPASGRFMSRDPVAGSAGMPTSLNRYAYADNGPTAASDPSGQNPLLVACAVGAVVGAAVGGVEASRNQQNLLLGIGEGAVVGCVGVLSAAVGVAVAAGAGLGAVTAGIVGGVAGSAISDATAQGIELATGQRSHYDVPETLVSAAVGGLKGYGYGAGRELTAGKNFRLAPFGNRTGNPHGELPHYHRRGLDPTKPGQTLPGQGIGRHRPWDTRSTDLSFWDRFSCAPRSW